MISGAEGIVNQGFLWEILHKYKASKWWRDFPLSSSFPTRFPEAFWSQIPSELKSWHHSAPDPLWRRLSNLQRVYLEKLKLLWSWRNSEARICFGEFPKPQMMTRLSSYLLHSDPFSRRQSWGVSASNRRSQRIIQEGLFCKNWRFYWAELVAFSSQIPRHEPVGVNVVTSFSSWSSLSNLPRFIY